MDPSSWTSVWAITSSGGVAFRQGVTSNDRKGTGWAQIDPLPCSSPSAPPSIAASLSLDTQGRPWVVTASGDVCVREDVFKENPMGTRWALLTRSGLLEGARIACVSAGTYGGAWACTTNGDIVARVGASPSTPFGLAWAPVKGVLTSISLSPCGTVLWGSNASGALFARTGVSPATPQGTQWTKIERPGQVHVRSVLLTETHAVCLGKSGEVWVYSGSIREPKVESTSFFSFGSSGTPQWQALKWQAQYVSVNLQSNDLWVTTATGSVVLLQRPESAPRDSPLHTWAAAVPMQQIASTGYSSVVAGASANHRMVYRPGMGAPVSPQLARPVQQQQQHDQQQQQQQQQQHLPYQQHHAYTPAPVLHDGAQASGAPYQPPPGSGAPSVPGGKGKGDLSGVPITIAGAQRKSGAGDFFVDVTRLPALKLGQFEYSFDVERGVLSRS